MNPGFQIGSVTFYYYGFILAVAMLTAFLTAKFLAKKEGMSGEEITELAIILIIPAIIGARIYHVWHFWNFYTANPVEIFFIWKGGIGIIGGILAGITTIFVYSKLRKLDFLKLADLAAPALVFAQSIGRIGNFLNSEGFGPPTDLPWGVHIPAAKRPEVFLNFEKFHPTFFYEAIGDFLIFLVLILVPGKFLGARFALYLILYSILRFGLEFLRIDTWQVDSVKIAQVVAVVGILAGVIILAKIFKFKHHGPSTFLPI